MFVRGLVQPFHVPWFSLCVVLWSWVCLRSEVVIGKQPILLPLCISPCSSLPASPLRQPGPAPAPGLAWSPSRAWSLCLPFVKSPWGTGLCFFFSSFSFFDSLDGFVGHVVTYRQIRLLGKLIFFFFNVVLVPVTYTYELFFYFLLGAYSMRIVSR